MIGRSFSETYPLNPDAGLFLNASTTYEYATLLGTRGVLITLLRRLT